MTRISRVRAALVAACLAAAPLAACSHPASPPIVVHAEGGDRAAGLTVTGTATIGVSPDCADLVLTITREAAKPQDAIAEVHARQTALVAALRELGVGDGDVTLSSVAVDPVYDAVAQHAELRGFQARVTITATTRRFDRIGALMEAGATAGATEMSSRFRRSDLDSMKKDVRDKAIAAARAKARETAAALGIALGRVTAVAESNQSYLFANTYFPAAAQAGAGGGLGGDLQPLTIDVTITYDLAGAA